MKRTLLLVCLVLALASPLSVQAQVSRLSGVITGVVTDAQGGVMPGATVTAEGPALMGKSMVVTDKGGLYRLANLPPGIYVITVQMPGFKTVKQTGITVQVGQTYTVNVRTEVSSVSEEVTVVGAAPVVDIQSSKVGGVVNSQMLTDLPLNRSLTSIFATVPGSSGTIDTYSGSIHGGVSTTVAAEIDGVNNNDPTHNGIMVTPQYDSMQEIEVVTGGLPAQVGNTGGAFINMVTKSGGNTFHGQAQVYYTRESMTESLYREEEYKAKGLSTPVLPFYDLNTSGSLGGPIMKDKIWFFTTLSRIATKYHTAFIPTTIAGKSYETYADPDKNYELFGKVTTQFSEKFRFFAMVNARDRERDVFDPGAKRAYDATFTLKRNTWVATTADLTWLVNPTTFVEFRGGYTNRWYPISAKDDVRANSGYRDAKTGYYWGAPTNGESQITRRTGQFSVRASHYASNLLGGTHEFGAGFEYQHGLDRYGYAKGNPVNFVWYNGNPYYYRGLYSLTSAHPTYGDGLLTFNNMSESVGDTSKDLVEDRMSAYIQDSFNYKSRLTLNLGVRFDQYKGGFGGGRSAGAGGLPEQVGATLASTLGFNPFGEMSLDSFDVISTQVFSPRVALAYKLTDDGKTAVKASYSKYAEALPVMRFAAVSPGIGGNFDFNWFDTNSNGVPDSPGTDRYVPKNGMGSFSQPNMAYLQSLVDENLKSPTYDEYTLSLTREIAKNFSATVRYINKRGFDQYVNARYDQTRGEFWYKYDQNPSYWVPFNTTVPAIGAYPAQTVTAYYMSENAPINETFLATNSSDTKRTYNAVELEANKRFSDGWSMGGSIVYSGLKSISGDNIGDNPNQFTNAYGRDWFDAPLAIKLYGSVRLPFNMMVSYFYQHTDRTPFGESVTIYAPSDWVAAHNVRYDYAEGVLLETSGTRRLRAYDNVDARLQKDVKTKFGTLAVWLDVFNVMGNRYDNIGTDLWLSTQTSNPNGAWYPDGANGTAGTYDANSDYGRTVILSGARTYKVSARFSF
jgi:hypothetical protein